MLNISRREELQKFYNLKEVILSFKYLSNAIKKRYT